MNKINIKNKKVKEKGISLFEIFLLVTSVLAFAYFIGNEFGIVSAAAEEGGGSCTPNWSCTPWSDWENNCGTRTCTDNNRCGTTASKPETSITCPTTNNPPAETSAAPVLTDVATGVGTALAADVAKRALGVAGGGAAGGTPTAGATGGAAGTGGAFWKAAWANLGTNVWAMLGNAAIAAGLYFGVKLFFDWSGWCPTCDPELVDTWALTLSVGYGVGAGVFYLVNALWIHTTGWAAFGLGAAAGGIGIVIAIIIMAIFYREDYIMAVQYNCYSWKPVTGGSDCDLCNDRDLPCTEYKCRSLGQGCELLNPGKTTEVCSFKDRNDIAEVKISAWNEALTEGYRYNPITTLTGDKGVEIINTQSNDGCVPPFARLDYGIKLDKLGQCRIDFVRKRTYDEMTVPGVISGGDWLKEHALFSLHGGIDAANASGIELPNGGEFEVFVRCLSANGVANTGTFVFKYCVSKEPDRTSPTIKLFDLPSGSPIQFGQTSREVKVYVDKPSDCKWSHTNQDYDTMPDSQKLSCSQTQGANTYYKCTTTLTGLKDESDNIFYFNCKSYPANAEANRYSMATSKEYKLVGTRLLVIDSVSPESGAIIKDATQSVKVTLKAETSAGYNNGQAFCYYKKKADADNRYVQFANTLSHESIQDLWFTSGSYRYTVKCCDLGGNCATKETDFGVETDFSSPIVVRAYNEGNSLKILTNEKAECVYDTTSCSYTLEDGIKMDSSDSIAHTTEWDTNTNFYIKCKDEFGNKPAPDGCSMIVRPFNSY